MEANTFDNETTVLETADIKLSDNKEITPMSSVVNPWEQKQVRAEMPRHVRLYPGDENDLQTLETLMNEERIPYKCELNDDTDYAIVNRDGSVTRVSEVITINGTQWILEPGINQVPRSIYELLKNRESERAKLPELIRSLNGHCLGRI